MFSILKKYGQVPVPVKAVCRREAGGVKLAVAAHRNGLLTSSNLAEDPLLHAQPVGVDDVVHVEALECVERRSATCGNVELLEEL